ncbi:MAG: PhoH family protein [Candidatus Anaerobiospirillum merdipullorum]|uniref:PhoH-like protein n=1 Tax=Candidatus Anaerobiospirillum merdipullorum TaxID=2838450 RepID=A0A9E2KP06_9GAMM|nr:PhoH family protein [Candidatus Anaerobiospirillum merdipullorum]
MPKPFTADFTLEPAERSRLAALIGPEDENLRMLQKRLDITIAYNDAHFQVSGGERQVKAACHILKDLYVETAPLGRHSKPQYITPDKVHLALLESRVLLQDDGEDDIPPADKGEDLPHHERGDIAALYGKASTLKLKRGVIKPRTQTQAQYVAAITTHDVNFGVGPAGTGKTYLAVAAAVDALERNEVRRIILTRPAVEAGEKLGFLPGDLSQKVDPYLRPLYDALFEMLGFEKVEKLIERQIIEIAPLAYMRGRTLNDSFIILDEAQNTTVEQMKMFLTRIGFNSKAVITGDPSQIDLPRAVRSGLKQALEVLPGIDSISFTYFSAVDVVRHPVVAAIVNAYAAFEKKEAQEKEQKRQEAQQRRQALAEAISGAPAVAPVELKEEHRS